VAGAALVSLGYAILSWRVGAAMALVSLVMLAIAAVYAGNETLPLWQPALVFLALGFFLWLFGRRIEGRPRYISEIAFDLLMGPAWIISKVLRLLRIGY
jgi:drug/metabolite transporter (DMT)-like permease